jgi:hypothetical protein
MFRIVAENNFGDTRNGSVAGPLSLLIIVLLAIGTVLLIRSMNKHLKRVPQSFPEQADRGDDPTSPGSQPS